MFTLTSHQSPGKRNLDYAFPPFAHGLPSVFERAGFDVNKSRSNSSSAGSAAGSAAGSVYSSPRSVRSNTPGLSTPTLNSQPLPKPGSIVSAQHAHSAPNQTTKILGPGVSFNQNSVPPSPRSSRNSKTSNKSSNMSSSPNGHRSSNKSDFSFNEQVKHPKHLKSSSIERHSEPIADPNELDSDLSDSAITGDILNPGLNHKQPIYGEDNAKMIQSAPNVSDNLKQAPPLPKEGDLFSPGNHHHKTWHQDAMQSEELDQLDQLEQLPSGLPSGLPPPVTELPSTTPQKPNNVRFRSSEDSLIPSKYPTQSPQPKQQSEPLSVPKHDYRASTTSSIYSMSQASESQSLKAPSSISAPSFDFGENATEDESLRMPAEVSDQETIAPLTPTSLQSHKLPEVPEPQPVQPVQTKQKELPPLPVHKELPVHHKELPALPPTPGAASISSGKARKQCRGCYQLIHGKSVKSADDALSGRWHRECFNCTRCSTHLFGKQKAHVLSDHPYCADCYHFQNNSTCRKCGGGIEGSCLETRSEDGFEPLMYHTNCLQCAECKIKLYQSYFEVQGETYCAEHAFTSLPRDSSVHQRYTQFMLM